MLGHDLRWSSMLRGYNIDVRLLFAYPLRRFQSSAQKITNNLSMKYTLVRKIAQECAEMVARRVSMCDTPPMETQTSVSLHVLTDSKEGPQAS